MTRPSAALAWTTWAVALALMSGDLGFLVARGHPLGGPLRLAAVVVAFTTLGAVIAARRPGHRLGWLFLAVAVLVGATGFARGYAVYGLVVEPGALPGAVAMAWLANWTWWVPLALTATFMFLLFPDGHLPSPVWRPEAWASGVVAAGPALLLALAPGSYWVVGEVMADPGVVGLGQRFVASDHIFGEELPRGSFNPLGVDAFQPLVEPGLGVAFAAVGVLALAAAASLILRFVRSRGDERQQLKWMAYAMALFIGWAAVGSVMEIPAHVDDALLTAISLVAAAAVGIAILKHRLYDIDRVISRTVSYALLTGLLIAVYVVVVFALQGLLRPITGESQLAIAGATLAVAALFGPARRRVQIAVDRRFNRARYDAERTVQEFRARLRDEVDLDQLGTELVSAARTTVEPSEVSLWLRPREADAKS